MKKFHDSVWYDVGVYLVCTALFLVLFFGVLTSMGMMEKHTVYPLTVVVVELDHDDDIVTCVDGANNFWEFYGVEDWLTGDYASLLMDDNATPNSIYDDVITMTLYAGTFEG